MINLFVFAPMQAQQDSIPKILKDSLHLKGHFMLDNNIDNLAPARAAFYSAVLPGLGQAYNKQYWKVPVVYAAIGTGVYFYISNGNEYRRFRTAYFNRKNGLQDEFPQYTQDVLIKAQKIYRRQRDTALMLTILAYFLNIIDANVSAHLKQWNVDENLSIAPVQFNTPSQSAFGLRLNFNITN